MKKPIPALTLRRTPLVDEAGMRMLKRLTEHPDAPHFNFATGDRLRPEDRPFIERFRDALGSERGPRSTGPDERILAWVSALRDRVPWFIERIPKGLDLARDWAAIPTSSRADLALAPWKFVPYGEKLDRLVVYRTAGTTGHPISVPHHPLAIRCYEPLLELALARHGVRPRFTSCDVACLLVGAQVRTYTYAALLYNWKGAGFAKLNIRPTEWSSETSVHRYFGDMNPLFLTGDPISFAEMMRRGIASQPAALVTTSVALSPTLRRKLERRYDAPVIDWYSLVETGPIAYGCPKRHGYHVLPHDIHVEVVRPDGLAAAPGEIGEIALSGGRNVYARLLRYRTGDFGRLDFRRCPCSDPMPRLLDLEGRQPLLFRSSDGTPVSTVDVSRLLREFPLLLHEFAQEADRACALVVRGLPGARVEPSAIEVALKRLLGDVPLSVRVDPDLGNRTDGKPVPYRSALTLED